jgi:hypothetical protein
MVVGVVCRFAAQLVAARKRHLSDFGNYFVGIHFEIF